MMDDEMTPRRKNPKRKYAIVFCSCDELIILSIYSLLIFFIFACSPPLVACYHYDYYYYYYSSCFRYILFGAAQHEQIMNMIGRRKRLSKNSSLNDFDKIELMHGIWYDKSESESEAKRSISMI